MHKQCASFSAGQPGSITKPLASLLMSQLPRGADNGVLFHGSWCGKGFRKRERLVLRLSQGCLGWDGGGSAGWGAWWLTPVRGYNTSLMK